MSMVEFRVYFTLEGNEAFLVFLDRQIIQKIFRYVRNPL
jgi:hypothetical protein